LAKICALSREAAHCRGGYFFFLDKKEAKNQVSREASLPHVAFALQNGQNLGREPIAPEPLIGRYAAKVPMPCRTQPTIVLPVFSRSLSADGKRGIIFFFSQAWMPGI